MAAEMTVDELIAKIEQLSVRDQLKIVEKVTRHLSETVAGTPSSQVRGLLATDKEPPTDEEIKDILAEALEEKYR
jgi:hypothetical protein